MALYPHAPCTVYNKCDTVEPMAKTAYVTARVEKKLKANAEKVLKSVGVKTSDALTMFYKQVIIQQGLPFEVCARSHVPNVETRRALRSAQDPKKVKRMASAATVEEMFEHILGKNWRRSL